MTTTTRTEHLLSLMARGASLFNARDWAALAEVHQTDMIAYIPGSAQPIYGREVIGHNDHLPVSGQVDLPVIAFVAGANARSRLGRALRLRSPRDTPLLLPMNVLLHGTPSPQRIRRRSYVTNRHAELFHAARRKRIHCCLPRTVTDRDDPAVAGLTGSSARSLAALSATTTPRGFRVASFGTMPAFNAPRRAGGNCKLARPADQVVDPLRG